MSGKVKLYYFDGRGRMESVRWLLAAAGIEFEEEFLDSREQYLKMVKDGLLMFEQVPMVEIDGLKLVQTRAILNYISAKAGLQGKDMKERVLVDMYVEGARDLGDMLLPLQFLPAENRENSLKNLRGKACNRYYPVFEKVLREKGGGFLVGNAFTQADLQLLEVIIMVDERMPDVLKDFPHLQEFKTHVSALPKIHAFLQPGSQRKRMPDDTYVNTVRKVLNM
uniref:glutathione S-transferase 3-like n=1 Tax=Myxine glutinosa TaxID=7769 RepID=UPI00358FB5FB